MRTGTLGRRTQMHITCEQNDKWWDPANSVSKHPSILPLHINIAVVRRELRLRGNDGSCHPCTRPFRMGVPLPRTSQGRGSKTVHGVPKCLWECMLLHEYRP